MPTNNHKLNRRFHLLTSGAILISLALLAGCPSGQQRKPKRNATTSGPGATPEEKRGKRSDGYFHVTAVGENMRQAKRLARKYIIEDGLGAFVESQSVAVDAQLKKQIIRSTSSGFVYDFHVVRIISKQPVVKIHAKGRVSKKAIGKAVKFQYAQIGKPRLMVVFRETIGSKPASITGTFSASKLIARFSDFDFVDQSHMRRLMSGSGIDPAAATQDSQALQKAVDAAAKLNADFLVVGETKVVQGNKIEGTPMHQIKAFVRFRMINVSNAVILATGSDTYTVPYINIDQGAVLAVERAVDAMYNPIIEQIGSKWEPGQTIRIVFEGIKYDDFIDKDIPAKLKGIQKVGTIRDRGKDPQGNPVIEVEALMSGPEFYRILRKVRGKLGLNFRSKSVKTNRIRVVVIP